MNFIFHVKEIVVIVCCLSFFSFHSAVAMYGEEASSSASASSASANQAKMENDSVPLYSLDTGPHGPFSRVASFLTLKDSTNFLSTSKATQDKFKENISEQIKKQSKYFIFPYKFKSAQVFRKFSEKLGLTQGFNSGTLKIKFASDSPSLRDWSYFFSKMQSLSGLDLSGNRLGVVGLKALFNSLPYSGIAELDLSDNQIDPSEAKALAYDLSRWPITKLNLSMNDLGTDGIGAISEELPGSHIEDLQLDSIDFSGALAHLAKVLTRSNIRVLSLKAATFGDDEMKALVDALPDTLITHLDLGDNTFNEQPAEALARALPKSQVSWLRLPYMLSDSLLRIIGGLLDSKVTHLDLSYTALGDEGIEALANVLPRTTIASLNLDSNAISSVGAETLAGVASQLRLARLDLGGNYLGNEGARTIIRIIPGSNLHSLNLAANDITDAGAKMIADYLRSIPNSLSKVSLLDLSENEIGDEGAQAISEALIYLKAVGITLDLRHNPIAEDVKARIRELFLNSSVRLSIDEEES